MSYVQLLNEYVKAIKRDLSLGNATEHSFRPQLKAFIEELQPEVIAVNEPRRIEVGAPDFILTRNNIPIGYIETKDIGTTLDSIEKSDQILRYREGIPNFILTNYLEFRWYVNGQFRISTEIAHLSGQTILPLKNRYEELNRLLENFVSESNLIIEEPIVLVKLLANYAKLIRAEMGKILKDNSRYRELHLQKEGIRQILLNDLTNEQLADMYAQTICYGLFAARGNRSSDNKLTRYNAAHEIPKTNPFLRKMFNQIVGPDLDEAIAWVIEDLIDVLNYTDVNKILTSFTSGKTNEDPIIYFYESFLSIYDSSIRELRGVYFTPQPIVSYIVRSVDELLKIHFGLKDGLADTTKIKDKRNDIEKEIHKVQILDPSTGTGTFLNEIIVKIYQSFQNKKGMWSSYVSRHLLPRLYGFEILMAPYTVAHMKIGLKLQELGFKNTEEERLKIFLTNTLEEAHEFVESPLFSHWLAEEANAASEIKKDVPVMVIVGNPPYKGKSTNNREWINELIRDYYWIDDQQINERNTKWLKDDYVKFIRLCQWRIDKTGAGILAFITNHRFLDNPTFRGMRQHIMKSFSEIYVIDLHGNARRGETTPEGKKDENVFDIEQGVSITFFVKKEGTKEKEYAKVYYRSLWGERPYKYDWLNENDIVSEKPDELKPQSPFYLFIPQDTRHYDEYQKGWKITDIFKVHSVGIVTARDKLTMQFSAEDVWKTIKDFSSLREEEARSKYNLDKDVRDWRVNFAQRDILESGIKKELIKEVQYRPFDIRYTYYTGKTRGFICMPRRHVMTHLFQEDNYAMITSRLTKGDTFKHVLISNNISDAAVLSSKTSCNGFIFPLYLYQNSIIQFHSLLNIDGEATRETNFSTEFLKSVKKTLGLNFILNEQGDYKNTTNSEQLFAYIYAILHSSTYRSRYVEYLKMDFPHIPLTTSNNLFEKLSLLGNELITLHLFKKRLRLNTTFPNTGNNSVKKYKFVADNSNSERRKGKVYINNSQYFGNVSEHVWQYYIGGYKVCEKWLKSRKGRVLTFDELEHFQKIIALVEESIRLVDEIEDVIEEAGGWPLI